MLLGKALKLLAVILALIWFCGFFYVLKNHVPNGDSSFWVYFATIANLNHFTFAILVAAPVLVTFFPFAIIGEWLSHKGETIEDRAKEKRDAANPKPRMGQFAPPKPRLTSEEKQKFVELSKAETDKTKAHLDEFFSKPRSYNKADNRRKRSSRRRRY
ncbi:hypothetical protein [Roseibium sp. MMSF_3412]|uniref:hypothetical protein n=1 Tax=Roseibium sp. MMSF_3412 TaxID=3046712 RepID=UPI00273E841A|nr:hypothetical protein [Roseibium sp. MMSF_3412]